jgi:L-galactose dehydrogenase/L-glyceraldehyde 3-phosphate reductase
LFDSTKAAGVGVVGIRVLAAVHCRARPSVTRLRVRRLSRLARRLSYEADIDRARRLIPLVEEGFAASLTGAATRFALSHPAWALSWSAWRRRNNSTDALAAAEKGPLPRAALDRLSALRQAFSGEPR